MSTWHLRAVPFKFQMSDLTLLTLSIPLQIRAVGLADELLAEQLPTAPPIVELDAGSQGFVIRGLPLAAQKSRIQKCGAFLVYVPQQYQHYFIDLHIGFDAYVTKFSSKTKATVMRKIRKYAEYSGGSISWKTYRTSEEMMEFLRLATPLSKSTYQDRLLDAGLPQSETFRSDALARAKNNRARAFVLFDRGRPVSYLYCPVDDGILTYAFQGYDPEYMHHSVGTVLQWLAVEQLFNEGIFRYFDFTEGQSDHKRLFATHHRQCANVFFLRSSIRNICLVHAHAFMDSFSVKLGEVLEHIGLKAKVKRFLRFAR